MNLFAGGKLRAPRLEVQAQPQQRLAPPAPKPLAVPQKTQTVTIEVFQGEKKIESTFRNPEAAPVGEARP
jgi:hypothetical protein